MILPVYSSNGSWSKRSTLARASVFCAAFICALIIDNPIFLTVLLMCILCAISRSGLLKRIKPYLKIAAIMAIMVMIINPLIAERGENLIWRFSRVPIFGEVWISLESLIYALAMTERLMIVLLISGLAALTIDPDRILVFLSRVSSRSSMTAALAVRLYPTTVMDAIEMKEVQELRGITGKGKSAKLKIYNDMFQSLLASSLDRAADIAESMESRGYGASKRTLWRKETQTHGDKFTIAGTIIVFSQILAFAIVGVFDFSFYPKIETGGVAPLLISAAAAGLLGAVLINAMGKKGEDEYCNKECIESVGVFAENETPSVEIEEYIVKSDFDREPALQVSGK